MRGVDPRIAAGLTDAELREIERLTAVPLDFRTFASQANPKYEWYRHCEVIADALEGIATGRITRLMVFMPPRHGKSELISRLFPAYYLSCFPQRWVAVASYSFELARTFSRSARTAYGDLTHDLSDDSAAVEMWETKSHGGLWAVGRGGSATGKGAHLMIVDDPLKDAEEANSEIVRDGLHEWYKAVVNTRLEPNGAIVIVHTRWNEADLAGELLEIERTSAHPEGWTIISLPALADYPGDAVDFPPTCDVIPDWRTPGEPLCPDRYSLERLASIRATSGERVWNSLFQQRPVEAGGQVFKREWWQRYTKAPERFDRVVQSWDLSFKDTDGADFVAGQVWGQVGARFYLLDRYRERASFSATCLAIRAMRQKWPDAHAIYVEDKANGPAVIDALTRTVPGIVAVNPEGGKIARAYAQQPLVEARQVFLPMADWTEAFIREHASFPNGRYDDEVDAFTQAMAKLAWVGGQRVEPTGEKIDVDRHPGFGDTHARNRADRYDPWAHGRDNTRPTAPLTGKPPTRANWKD